MSSSTLLLGQTLSFDHSPFAEPPAQAARHRAQGAVLIQDGKIAAIGDATELRAAHPQADIVDHGDHLISAGFVDTHVHYPQTAIIASWGKRLIDWLNSYTFPEEIRLNDAGYAAEISARYLDLALANGTTTMASYCTSHPQSVEAFFSAAQARNMRVVAGKTCMDRNAPEALIDSAARAYDESKALLQRWHGQDRLSY
ncbi:MAG: amidohydrolase family protein, partial [Mangrovicoccus sp.]|nr:amidohydrolase family protein [Mangrovicoccus sp.]